ncbi:hypothetical protein [Aquimarina celericrescens]|uniref:Bacteriocin n=1 Tax=Aquimarina celericrescens TaxID=1964542 RepID=A0ABW5AUS6_9FLAO|nr:hypothetical protein [Aquimarina celericrescens]
MLKDISNLGRPLNSKELKSIKGGNDGPCVYCFCAPGGGGGNCCCVNR